MRLRSVLDAALRNIHSSSHLFKLAQDAFRLGLPGEGQRNSLLLNAALELGLQVSVHFFQKFFLFLSWKIDLIFTYY